MQIINGSSKELKINYVTAISTAILAFVAIIGLFFVLVELIGKDVLHLKEAILIFILIFLGLFIIISIIRRWIKK